MKNKIIPILAACIKYHRKQAGLTQLELAELAGVGKTVVFDIEHEKASVQLNSLLKILKVLNISIHFKSPLMSKFEVFYHHAKS